MAASGQSDRARAAGVRAAVLSSSWGAGVYDPYGGYDLHERFDAGACVFVDDTEHNLPPAAALGMAAVYLTDPITGVDDTTTALELP